jgi:mannose-6-phosphate isomerase-like protein (cupin superfamily)
LSHGSELQKQREQRHGDPMTILLQDMHGLTLDSAHVFDITGAKARLCAGDGGYEIVHESQGRQICVYALVAPEPDHQRANADDQLYVVLEGRGTLDVDGAQLELQEGSAAFIPAGADHCFSSYEHLTVLAILEKSSGDASTMGSAS